MTDWDKIILTLFFIFAINSSVVLSLEELLFNTTQLKYENLKTCLILAGVNDERLVEHDSGDAYTELNWQWNTLNGYIKPMAYLLANEVSDIQKAVICCNKLNIRIVPRSGGHSYTKFGFGESTSLVVDLSRLNKISSDGRRMTCNIGAGARIGLINYKLLKKGNFLIPLGVCPTVGIAGLTLGGGFGYFTRRYGLTSDNLLELEMVDAKGDLLTINGLANEDLFWALRGGGGGNFGIVTKLKFKMYQAPKRVAYAIFMYDLEDFVEFFSAYQSFVASDLPNKIGTYVTISKNYIEMEICDVNFRQKPNGENEMYFEERFLGLFPAATEKTFNVTSYSDFLLLVAQYYSNTTLTNVSQFQQMVKHQVKNSNIRWKKVQSFYVDKVLDIDGVIKLKKLLYKYLNWIIIMIENYGGAINNLMPSETAFVHREKNLYNVQIKAESEEMNMEIDVKAKQFFEESKEALNHQESYQNYLDGDLPDYLERYYGANLKKLIEVKSKIDPGNVFHHPLSIPVNHN